MGKIAVMTDSTALISNEIYEQNDNLFFVPLQFLFGEESYLDCVDMTTDEFYDKLENFDGIPSSSQPSIGYCIEKFEELLKDFDKILFLPISSKLSGEYQSAVMAANEVDPDNIIVFDSYSVSAPLAFMTLTALELVNEGKGIEEIVEVLERYKNNSGIYFALEDLTHLRKNGRIGPAAATLGNALKIKPVLELSNGEINTSEKVRTLKKAHDKVIKVAKGLNFSKDTYICVLHTNALDFAESVKEKLQVIYPNHEINIESMSPVVGVHIGPGAVGFAYVNK